MDIHSMWKTNRRWSNSRNPPPHWMLLRVYNKARTALLWCSVWSHDTKLFYLSFIGQMRQCFLLACVITCFNVFLFLIYLCVYICDFMLHFCVAVLSMLVWQLSKGYSPTHIVDYSYFSCNSQRRIHKLGGRVELYWNNFRLHECNML